MLSGNVRAQVRLWARTACSLDRCGGGWAEGPQETGPGSTGLTPATFALLGAPVRLPSAEPLAGCCEGHRDAGNKIPAASVANCGPQSCTVSAARL